MGRRRRSHARIRRNRPRHPHRSAGTTRQTAGARMTDKWDNVAAEALGEDSQDATQTRYGELELRLVDIAGLEAIPPPEFLIDGYLIRNSLAWLGGKPGHYKSFVAVEMACCVATGTNWHGYKVKQGKVLYLIAEGV